jgi:hypothetical protein
MRKVIAISAALALAGCGDGSGGVASFACANGGRPLALDVGEARRLTMDERRAFCVQGGSDGSDFVLVPFHASTVPSARIQLEVAAPEAVATADVQEAAPAGAAAGPSLSIAGRGEGRAPLVPDAEFHGSLRRAERALASRFRAVRQRPAARSGVSLSRARLVDLRPNDVVSLNADGNTSCEDPDFREGRVVAVSTHAVIVADVENPADGFTDDEYRELAAAFDTLAYPVNVENFGETVNVFGQGKVIVFYTRSVNELTEPESDSYVGGFFHPRDLFPREAIPDQSYEGCEGSNESEMFYMLVPDPTGVVNGNRRSKDFVSRVTVGTLAHELQHLINASRRIYVTGADEEESWLNEGLSHIAEELVFYRASGYGPGENIDVAEIRASERTREAANRYAVSNFGRLVPYLEDPELNSPYAADDELATRGAAWQLLRYAADQRGGDERSLWRGLVNSTTYGVANFNAVFGVPIADLAREWSVAQYLDDTAHGRDAKHKFPSWDLRSILPEINEGKFPLKLRALTAAAPQTLRLTAGGTAYLRFGVPAGVVVPVTPTVQGSPPPSNVELTLVRTR